MASYKITNIKVLISHDETYFTVAFALFHKMIINTFIEGYHYRTCKHGVV